jgi:hypothetical protein
MRKMLIAVAMMLLSCAAASAQNYFCGTQICAVPVHYLSAATTNSTSVKPAPGALYNIVAVNTTPTNPYYLKLYDKATAPVCGTDIPVQTLPLSPTPAAGPGVPLVLDSAVGISFNNGIGFCITANPADNDNTAAVAGIVVNMAYR